VLTGEGDKAFIAGADISYMVSLPPWQPENGQSRDMISAFVSKTFPPAHCVRQWVCLGRRAEMAMACDFIYASENANSGSLKSTWALSRALAGPRGCRGLWAKALRRSCA